MADNGDLDYLSPDFDPAALTVPKLRNILLEYNVNYPSSSKKPQLVELFKQNVAPQAKKVLAARARTKPSARGIIDVPSSQVSVADDDEDLEDRIPEPPAEKPKRTSRRSTRQPTEEADTTLLAAPDTARRTSSRPSKTPEVETAEERTTVRKTRKSVTPAAPRVKAESPMPVVWNHEDTESPFTQDNPFQSGASSPPVQPAILEKRRRTIGPVEQKERKRSASGRRKTDFPINDSNGGLVRRKDLETPVVRISRRAQEEAEEQAQLEEEAGEEFTAEEQEELSLERASHGESHLVPVRRRANKSALSSLGTPLLVVLLAATSGIGYVWQQEKLEVGYCGVGRPSTSLAGYEVPDWASSILPQCEQCPQHAYCYPRLQASCEHGFILTPHPLTANGLIPLPLPPTCEPDTEKSKKVKAVADRAIEQLRDRNAKYECGELRDEEGKHAKTSSMPEQTLKKTVSSMKKRSMSQEEFDSLWQDAIGEIMGRDEVSSTTDGTLGRSRLLSSNSLARVSIGCAIRKSIRETLVKYLFPLVLSLLFVASGFYTRYSINQKKLTEQKARQLASYAMDRLSTQATLHNHDSAAYPDAFISMTHLRDDVLRDEFSATRRLKLWEQVQKKVEGNSNIRSMIREGRHGDRSRVWEWVGAVGALEDAPRSALNSGRRDGGSRMSSGGMNYNSSPPSVLERKGSDRGDTSNGIASNGKEMQEIRHWEEGRPIY